MLTALLLVSLGLSPQIAAGADLCAQQEPGASVSTVVIRHARQMGDSVLTVTVCVIPARSAAKAIGSYHGELHFDSTAVAAVQVRKPEGGVRVENTTLKGQVNFAGAAPSGFPGRALVTVQLRLAKPDAQPGIRLEMKELNATDGASLMPQVSPRGSGGGAPE